MEPLVLPPGRFDVVLLGTSLATSLLSAALSLHHKRVLHLDALDRYGSLHSSFTLNDLLSLSSPSSSPSPSPPQWIDLDEVQSDVAQRRSRYRLEKVHVTSNVTFQAIQRPFSLEDLQRHSRHFSLDLSLSSSALLSRSNVVHCLASSSAHSYVDFRPVDVTYLYETRRGLRPVPSSRSQVFASPLLSLVEKRELMRFIECIVPNHKVSSRQREKDEKELKMFAKLPFDQFLNEKGLEKPLSDFIAYGIARLTRCASVSSTGEAVEKMRLFLTSLGRYSPGAHLYPIWGVSEMPQAFARLSAVHNGIFVLRCQPEALIFDVPSAHASTDSLGENNQEAGKELKNRRFRGIIHAAEQLIEADHFVVEAEYLINSVEVEESEWVSCAMCIIDKELQDANGQSLTADSLCVFPPQSVGDNPQPVHIIQLSHSVKVTPANHFVLYASAPRVQTAQSDLQPILDAILVRTQTGSELEEHSETLSHQLPAVSDPPHLLFRVFFERRILREKQPNSFASNLFVVPSASPIESLDACVRDAESIFSRICPEVPLFDTFKKTGDHESSSETLLTYERGQTLVNGGDQQEQSLISQLTSTITDLGNHVIHSTQQPTEIPISQRDDRSIIASLDALDF